MGKSYGKMADRKERALAALLSCSSFAEAAREAGIDRRTMYTYIHNDYEFSKAYAHAQECATLDRLEKAREAARMAEAVVRDLMDDAEQKPEVRLKAAQIILDKASAIEATALSITKEWKQNKAPFTFPADGDDTSGDIPDME